MSGTLVKKLVKTEHTIMSILALPLNEFKKFIQECIAEEINLNNCLPDNCGILHYAMLHNDTPEENIDYLLSLPEIEPLYECDDHEFWPIEKFLHFTKPAIKQSVVDKIIAAIDARNKKTAERYKRFIDDSVTYKNEKKRIDDTLAFANEVLERWGKKSTSKKSS